MHLYSFLRQSHCGYVHPDHDDAAPENFKPIRTDNTRLPGDKIIFDSFLLVDFIEEY